MITLLHFLWGDRLVPAGADVAARTLSFCLLAVLVVLAVASAVPFRFSGPLGGRERRALTRGGNRLAVALAAATLLSLLDATVFLFAPPRAPIHLVLHSRLRPANPAPPGRLWGQGSNLVDFGPVVDEVLNDLERAGAVGWAVVTPAVRKAMQPIIVRRVAAFERLPLPDHRVPPPRPPPDLPSGVVESVELSVAQLLMATDDVRAITVAAGPERDVLGGWVSARKFWTEISLEVDVPDTPATPSLKVRRLGGARYRLDQASGKIELDFSGILEGANPTGTRVSVGVYSETPGTNALPVMERQVDVPVSGDGDQVRFFGNNSPIAQAESWERLTHSRIWIKDLHGDAEAMATPATVPPAVPVLSCLNGDPRSDQWKRLFDQAAPPSRAGDPDLSLQLRDALRAEGNPLPRFVPNGSANPTCWIHSWVDNLSSISLVSVASSERTAREALEAVRRQPRRSVQPPLALGLLRGQVTSTQPVTAFTWAEVPVRFAHDPGAGVNVWEAGEAMAMAAEVRSADPRGARVAGGRLMPLLFQYKNDMDRALIIQLNGSLDHLLPATQPDVYDPTIGMALLASIARGCRWTSDHVRGPDAAPGDRRPPGALLRWSGPVNDPADLERAVRDRQKVTDCLSVAALGAYLALLAWTLLANALPQRSP